MTWHYIAIGPSLVFTGLRVMLVAFGLVVVVLALIVVVIETRDW